MSTVDEHTPLLHQAQYGQQDQHLRIHYPIVTVKELNQRLHELANSTTDDQGLSDLVANGGDAAFYVVVNSLLLQPLDKHKMLESWAIKVLDMLLQDQHDPYHIRIRQILLHEWEAQGSALDIILQLPAMTVLLYRPVQDGINGIWKDGNPIMTDLTAASRVTRFTMIYFGKWRSPKYQALLQFITGAIYVSLYLATVANQNYTVFPPHVYEYVFYVFALSDLILETLNVSLSLTLTFTLSHLV
ncbi:hypothetical protein K450DRAFT_255735 [Umbelopsis ramanniana AG]|uniref:Uncharacterized protein n=1 Tax=Umbelopsis ramanniana AG TaxID=1314678 RepID=A0AAD5HBC8_UMBRA|nr:uncharacterized protein K450DRAFT_255735 [Umbelopsis ramanniana AG]KAI8576704.1 hypothetical protein K450DRAFT_255735 [Umbelopsis ramanniana AG]